MNEKAKSLGSENRGQRAPVLEPFVPTMARWLDGARTDTRSNAQCGQQRMRAALLFVDMNDFVKLMLEADVDVETAGERAYGRPNESYGRQRAELLQRRRDELIRGVLREYFSRLTAIVDAYGGEIISFIGDAMLAGWFAERGSDDDRELVSLTRLAAFCAECVVANVHGSSVCERLRVALKAMISCGDVIIVNTGDADGEREALLLGEAVDGLRRLKRSMQPGRVAFSTLGLQLLADGSASANDISRERPSNLFASAGFAPDLVFETSADFTRDALSPAGASCAACTVTFLRFHPDRDRAHGEEEFVRDMELAVRVIQRTMRANGGVVLQIIVDENGPSCLCAFGIARSRKHQAPSRAVKSTQSTLKAFAKTLPAFRIAAGVCTGSVNLGPAGSAFEPRRELTLIGIPVILAARFADTAINTLNSGSALMDYATRIELVPCVMPIVTMEMRLKGFPHPVRAFACGVE